MSTEPTGSLQAQLDTATRLARVGGREENGRGVQPSLPQRGVSRLKYLLAQLLTSRQKRFNLALTGATADLARTNSTLQAEVAAYADEIKRLRETFTRETHEQSSQVAALDRTIQVLQSNLAAAQENLHDLIARIERQAADHGVDGPRSSWLKSESCRQDRLETAAFRKWAKELMLPFWYHRKLWEFCYICQALAERGKLAPGMRGLGFAVGQESLPALFARYGCEVVATDLGAADEATSDVANSWAKGGQHAASLDALNKRGLCPPDEFARLVTFRPVDMNHVPDDLRGFDFLWSACAIEHVGSLELSKQAVLNMMRCLKPGGVAVHTTEFNVLSNTDTIEKGWTVAWRRKDLQEVAEKLHQAGHRMEVLDLSPGHGFADHVIDEPPYKGNIHLKLRLEGVVSTSTGLIIEAGGA